MKIKLITKSGNESTQSVDLVDSVWKVPMNKDLVSQVVHVYMNNQRKHTAKTKTRGEVRGGGKKPWAQKGTGRARHGSIRSPLWVGGGTVFGPSNYKKMLKVPKKMRDISLKCVLSDKAQDKNVLVIKSFDIKKHKTKEMKELINSIGLENKKLLVVYGADVENKDALIKSLKNLDGVRVINAGNLNTYRVMDSEKVLISEDAVKQLEKRLK